MTIDEKWKSAFPNVGPSNNSPETGKALLDEFAGLAMQAQIARIPHGVHVLRKELKTLAKESYLLATYMVEARARMLAADLAETGEDSPCI